MRRREFIAPLAERAQQPDGDFCAMRRSVPSNSAKAMKEAGFVERQNVVIEYRSASNLRRLLGSPLPRRDP